ncbi:MAG TPA: UbiX family flavin prenyltransferase [Dehalococcoidia bacterium]|nr:UbiX family flavin prenyltransferase [Dehalococcoidia bacterium]
MILIIGITGASGAIYGIRLLEVLSACKEVETHLIVSEAAEQIIKHETDWSLDRVKALADNNYDIDDIGASLSSGSFRRDGMIIAPCSMKTMSALANSYTDNLITRAADITLKEKKKLVVLARETPLHLGHLRNMVQLTEMGAVIFPPVPGFYYKPKSIMDLVDHAIGKVLDLFDIPHELFTRWSGLDNVK